MTSQWRRSREAAEYREITENLNDALYALVIIRARNEQLIQTHTKKEIRDNLNNGINTIDSLLETHTEPVSGSLVQEIILEESEITLEDLQQTRSILQSLKENPYVGSQPSLEETAKEPEKVAENTLEELDDTASARFRDKYRYKR